MIRTVRYDWHDGFIHFGHLHSIQGEGGVVAEYCPDIHPVVRVLAPSPAPDARPRSLFEILDQSAVDEAGTTGSHYRHADAKQLRPSEVRALLASSDVVRPLWVEGYDHGHTKNWQPAEEPDESSCDNDHSQLFLSFGIVLQVLNDLVVVSLALRACHAPSVIGHGDGWRKIRLITSPHKAGEEQDDDCRDDKGTCQKYDLKWKE